MHATGHRLGLLQQAKVLKECGFDTGGNLDYVHITEAHTEASYTIGKLTVPKNEVLTERNRLRVRQWVVGFTPTI
jgi:hypothetical protein